MTSSYLEVGENAVLFVSESSSIHGEVFYAHLGGNDQKISNEQNSNSKCRYLSCKTQISRNVLF